MSCEVTVRPATVRVSLITLLLAHERRVSWGKVGRKRRKKGRRKVAPPPDRPLRPITPDILLPLHLPRGSALPPIVLLPLITEIRVTSVGREEQVGRGGVEVDGEGLRGGPEEDGAGPDCERVTGGRRDCQSEKEGEGKGQIKRTRTSLAIISQSCCRSLVQ